MQFREIDDAHGPNRVGLRQARINFDKFGAMEERFVEVVRKPLPEEHPRYDWSVDPDGYHKNAQA